MTDQSTTPTYLTLFLVRKIECLQHQNDLSFLDEPSESHQCLRPNICSFKLLSIGRNYRLHFIGENPKNSPYHQALRMYMEYYTTHLARHIRFIAFGFDSISRSTPLSGVQKKVSHESITRTVHKNLHFK